jgi:SAM-dependent methyltransferase
VKRCAECEARFDGQSWICPACGHAPGLAGAIPRFATPAGRDGFDPAAFDRLAALEHSSSWFRARNRLIGWALRRYFPHARSMMEIGCGTGFVLEGLRRMRPGLKLVGGDLHVEGLAHAARRVPGIDLLQLDARRIPFDAEFDVIGAFDVIEHIDDDELVLKEMRRALVPGGGIVLTVPQHPWLWSVSDDYAEHKRRYRRAELVSKVQAAGFTIRRVSAFVTLLLPAMAAMRLRGRLRKGPIDPFREHLIAQRLAAPLDLILELEHSLIARGSDLPAGGSLLLVAVRSS